MNSQDIEKILNYCKDLMGDLLFNILTDGVKIVFPDNHYIKTLGGIYYKNTKTIVIYTDDLTKILWVFFHELAHHVFRHLKYGRFFKFDYLLQAFRNYQNGKYHFDLGHQAKCSISEFFSEIFALYFIDPRLLIENDKRLFIEL
ncbi:MAG: hypothetical protein ACP5O4_07405 [bacterium]